MDRSTSHVTKSYADQRKDQAAAQTAPAMGLNCPRCGSPLMVTNTRKRVGAVVRYRRCPNSRCNFRSVTEEK